MKIKLDIDNIPNNEKLLTIGNSFSLRRVKWMQFLTRCLLHNFIVLDRVCATQTTYLINIRMREREYIEIECIEKKYNRIKQDHTFLNDTSYNTYLFLISTLIEHFDITIQLRVHIVKFRHLTFN